MKKVLILCFLAAGCTSLSDKWAKNDSSAYDIKELEVAMADCHYKKSMKASNVLMMGSNSSPRARAPSPAIGEPGYEKAERLKARDDKMNKRNDSNRQISLRLAKSANKCMNSAGFKRT